MAPRAWISFPPWRAIRILRVNRTPASIPFGSNYLLEVDHPLVIPSGTKVRLLLTSQDVIHAWWCRTSAQNARRFPASSTNFG